MFKFFALKNLLSKKKKRKMAKSTFFTTSMDTVVNDILAFLTVMVNLINRDTFDKMFCTYSDIENLKFSLNYLTTLEEKPVVFYSNSSSLSWDDGNSIGNFEHDADGHLGIPLNYDAFICLFKDILNLFRLKHLIQTRNLIATEFVNNQLLKCKSNMIENINKMLRKEGGIEFYYVHVSAFVKLNANPKISKKVRDLSGWEDGVDILDEIMEILHQNVVIKFTASEKDDMNIISTILHIS
uniref:ORF8 n=1 Tax=Little cherry virus 1 TaxID=217686 RepID=A0A344AIG7_9CLOS|nr:ORF8 [Little cherry virus 1]